ncbi:hypothetical protein [Bacillus mycoides]|uniref:hypothetical protein n=1 Tax=Bacillus mycoides TaxID=1405 RepID=UPI002112D0FB|nr:hypothetical protein [Bacillus mycoides]MCQ6530843.1 hypothetical protein [Bacillus mycoides]
MMQTYLGTEVAKKIGIGKSTLRKYCVALEKAGYVFERSNKNARIFYYNDIEILKKLLTVIKKNMKLEPAIQAAMTNVTKNKIIIVGLDNVVDTDYIQLLVECIERLEQLNITFLQILEQQNKMRQDRNEKNKR